MAAVDGEFTRIKIDPILVSTCEDFEGEFEPEECFIDVDSQRNWTLIFFIDGAEIFSE